MKLLNRILNIDENTGNNMGEVNSLSDLLVTASCTQLEMSGSKLLIAGLCSFTDYPPIKEEMIRHKLIFMKDNKVTETVTMESIKNKESNFWQNYRGQIQLSKITKNGPLASGRYEIFIEFEQFVNQKWLISRTKVGRIVNIFDNLVYSSKVETYTSTSNKVVRLVVDYDYSSKMLRIESRKLSDINPTAVNGGDIKQDNVINRKLKRGLLLATYRLFKLLPVEKSKISFVSDSRIEITGNFEYIYEEIIRQKLAYKIGFYFKKSLNEKKTYREILALARAFATSRYIILDDYYPLIYPLKLRKGTELIQVWHAVGAFKTFGYSRLGMAGGPNLNSLNHKNYSKVLVSSQNIVSKYSEGFGIDEEKIISLGIPRTDLFFDEIKKAEIVKTLNNEFPFIKGKKVILFAPTFRGNGQQSAYYPYEMLNFKKIYEELKEDYVFLLKIHPFVQNSPDVCYDYQEFYYDVSNYPEINNLLLISDCLITDYSSVCFEYALLKRPMVFFCPDLSEYMISRNFYYDYFNFIPGSLATNTDQLIDQVSKGEFNELKINSFIKYFFDYTDGKSSKRLVDTMRNNFIDYEKNHLNDRLETTKTVVGKTIPKWGKI